MYVWHVPEPKEAKSGHQNHATGITEDYDESLSGFWQLTRGPLQEQHVLLTAEQSPRPQELDNILKIEINAIGDTVFQLRWHIGHCH